MAAAILVELADEELAVRHETVDGSRSLSDVNNSGLAVSQQAIPSCCRSRKCRLVSLVVALLCVFAGLGIIAAKLCEPLAAEKQPGAEQVAAEAQQGADPPKVVSPASRGFLGEEAEALPALERTWNRWRARTVCNKTLEAGVPNFLSKVEAQKRGPGTIPGSWWTLPNGTRYSVRGLKGLPPHIGGVHAALYRGQSAGHEAPDVIIKVKQMEPREPEHILAAMYHKDLQCRLINSIGGNVLGYLDVVFPSRAKTSFLLTRVMEDAGSPSTCLIPDGVPPDACPKTEHWANGAFSLRHKAAIVLGALRAVQSMQRKGFLKHGDVSPRNLMLPQNALTMTPVQLAEATRLIDHDTAVLDFEELPPVIGSQEGGFVPQEVIDLHGVWSEEASVARKKVHSRMDVFACGMTLLALVVEKGWWLLLVDCGIGEGEATRTLFHLADFFLHPQAKCRAVHLAGKETIPLLQGMLEQNGDRRWDVAQAVQQVQKFCCEGE